MPSHNAASGLYLKKMSDDLKTKWWIWHRDNREVYDAFEKIALELIQEGYARYSSDGILHIVRYSLNRKKKESERYKINNNWSAYYSRLFTHYHPEHSDFFETRELRSNETNQDDIPVPAQAVQNVLDFNRGVHPGQTVLGDQDRALQQPTSTQKPVARLAYEKWMEQNQD